jgi:hypothetical protein
MKRRSKRHKSLKREELTFTESPPEALEFFSKARDNLDRVVREAEEHARMNGRAIRDALATNKNLDTDQIYRLLEGAYNFGLVKEFDALVERYLGRINPNLPLSHFRRTPFQLAAGMGSIPAMAQLHSCGGYIETESLRRSLFRPECVVWLLDRHADPNTPGPWGLTCLMEACLGGLTETVEALLKHGASVDAQEVEGRTALWFSSRNRRQKCVELLLGAGADPNLADHYGRTPLMRAKNLAIATVLLQSGADPNLKDNEGRTASDLASGRLEFRQLLARAVC